MNKFAGKGKEVGGKYYASSDWINSTLEIKDSYQAPKAMMEIVYDKERRQEVFMKFLEEHNFDVSYDWFTFYFQDEHADRKNKKQDFTPLSVSKLLTALTVDENDSGTIYDGCSGTGGLLIVNWRNNCLKHNPFDYKPSQYLYVAEELSDRAIPFLLFNLMIRGMQAVVHHCDVLTRACYGTFFVQNDKDDALSFSSLNLVPYPGDTPIDVELSWEEADECDIIGHPVRYVQARYTPITESINDDGDFPGYIAQMATDDDYYNDNYAQLFGKLCGF